MKALNRLAKIQEKEVPHLWRNSFEKRQTIKRIDKLIELLRRQLRELLLSVREHPLLADNIYQLTLLLAEYKPINREDPIYQMEIEAADRVVVAAGWQYDLNALIGWHQARLSRRVDGESDQSKWLLNPFTNEKFSSRDARHILHVIREKRLNLPGAHFMYDIDPAKMSMEQYDSLGLSHRLALVDYPQEASSLIERGGLRVQQIQIFSSVELELLFFQYDYIKYLLDNNIFSFQELSTLKSVERIRLLERFTPVICIAHQEASLPNNILFSGLSSLLAALDARLEDDILVAKLPFMTSDQRRILFGYPGGFSQLLNVNVSLDDLLALTFQDLEFVLISSRIISVLMREGILSAQWLLPPSPAVPRAHLHASLPQLLEAMTDRAEVASLLGISLSQCLRSDSDRIIELMTYPKEVELCVYMLNISPERLMQLQLPKLEVLLKGAWGAAAILKDYPAISIDYLLNQQETVLAKLFSKPCEVISLLHIQVPIEKLIEQEVDVLAAILNYVENMSEYSARINVSVERCLMIDEKELREMGLEDIIPLPAPVQIDGQLLSCQSLIRFLKQDEPIRVRSVRHNQGAAFFNVTTAQGCSVPQQRHQ